METIGEWILTYGPPVVGIIVVLVVAYMASGWLGRWITSRLEKSKVEKTLARFAGSITRWGLMVLVLIACLGYFGLEMTSFAALIGASALAIGLAFMGSLSNLAAGVMLMIFRPFRVGDIIEVSDEIGKVDQISLFSTQMDTFDNRRIIIPNSKVFGSTIENFTHHPNRRVDISVGVSYTADIDQTREILNRAAFSVPNRLEDPAPQVILLELGNSSLNWQVRVWTKTENYWDVLDAATRAVKMELDHADIGIPFPQMDVHFDRALVQTS